MPRLIVVSNRVPHHVGTRLQPGGLTVAVQPVLKAGDLWAGWSGRISDHDGDPSIALAKDGIGFVTLDLTPGEHRGYYTGFANGTLWPLLHFRPHLMRYEAQEFAAYQAVNEKFARALARVIQPDDRIWIHDYHLMTLGARLRRLGVKNRIGFFLHIPFAPPSLFSELPCAADIINALCACDVLGFQTRQSAADFIACAREISGLCVSAPDAISDGVRRVQVGVIPAGIETDAVAATARHLPRDRMLDRLAASLGGKALVIGTDRLDYSKGIASRFEAYARLLTRWPEHKRNVSFLQIAAPSREDVEAYAALKRELDIKIYVDTDADIRAFRRIRRDLEQRGRSFESVREQYYRTVRPMHLLFVEPSKRCADVDLGRWLTEAYAIPAETEDEADEPVIAASADAQGGDADLDDGQDPAGEALASGAGEGDGDDLAPNAEVSSETGEPGEGPAEGAGAERRDDRAVDPSGHADDRAAPPQGAEHLGPDRLDDALGLGRGVEVQHGSGEGVVFHDFSGHGTKEANAGS